MVEIATLAGEEVERYLSRNALFKLAPETHRRVSLVLRCPVNVITVLVGPVAATEIPPTLLQDLNSPPTVLMLRLIWVGTGPRSREAGCRLN